MPARDEWIEKRRCEMNGQPHNLLQMHFGQRGIAWRIWDRETRSCRSGSTSG